MKKIRLYQWWPDYRGNFPPTNPQHTWEIFSNIVMVIISNVEPRATDRTETIGRPVGGYAPRSRYLIQNTLKRTHQNAHKKNQKTWEKPKDMRNTRIPIKEHSRMPIKKHRSNWSICRWLRATVQRPYPDRTWKYKKWCLSIQSIYSINLFNQSIQSINIVYPDSTANENLTILEKQIRERTEKRTYQHETKRNFAHKIAEKIRYCINHSIIF